MNYVNQHGRIVFFGIEIPVSILEHTRIIYSDNCIHKYSNNSKKKEYKFCSECGTKRFMIVIERPELYKKYENRIIFAKVVDPDGQEHKKYYIVLEWYEGDVKICYGNLLKQPALYDDFKMQLEEDGIWKQKWFGLYTLENPQPTQAFYKNLYIKNNVDSQYCKLAIYVDPKINSESKTKEEELVDAITRKAEQDDKLFSKLDKTLPAPVAK